MMGEVGEGGGGVGGRDFGEEGLVVAFGRGGGGR